MIFYLNIGRNFKVDKKIKLVKIAFSLLLSYPMLTIQPDPLPLIFDTEAFKIKVFSGAKKLDILMVVNSHDLTTKYLPQTLAILQTSLPTICQHKCFNNYNLPFSEELKNTEVGHLFEHIMLEYLSLTKLESGRSNACFSGETSWDWRVEDRGIFHIDIKMSKNDFSLVNLAVQKSIALMNMIMLSKYSLHPNTRVEDISLSKAGQLIN